MFSYNPQPVPTVRKIGHFQESVALVVPRRWNQQGHTAPLGEAGQAHATGGYGRQAALVCAGDMELLRNKNM